MRRGVFQIGGVLAAVAVLATGGCGGDEAPGGLASLVPPDAPLYVEAVVRPGGDQADAVRSFANRVAPGVDPGAELIAGVDRVFADNGLDANYADDVEPWVGDHAAGFVRSFESSGVAGGADFAVMVEVTDADAARDFLARIDEQQGGSDEQRSYRGTDYYYSPDQGGLSVGVIDGRALALGTESAFKVAVDASMGESLAKSQEYMQRAQALPDDPLATVFLEPETVIEAALSAQNVEPAQAHAIAPLLAGALGQPIAVALTATTDTASLDFAAMISSDRGLSTESSLLDRLPGGSWLAAAVPNLGPTLVRTLDQLSRSGIPGAGQIERRIHAATGLDLGHDVLGWLGDAAVFVEGTAVPGFKAGLIAQASDREAPRRLLEQAQRLAERDSGLRSSGPPEGAAYGFSIGIPSAGGGAEAGVVDGMLVAVIGATVQQALHPPETLGDDPGFQAAVASLGGDLAPALYIQLPSLFAVAREGAGTDPGSLDYAGLAPYLDAFASLVVGSRVEDGLVLSRATVSLAPG